MAIIGEDDETGLSAFDETTSEPIKVMDGFGSYVAGADEEVFRFGAFQSAGGDANDVVEVGLYDITSGVSGATLVASATLNGNPTGGSWVTHDLASPVALTEGNTYAVAWASQELWNAMRASQTAACNRHSTLTGGDALPASWTEGADISQRYAFYAETQASSGASAGRGRLVGGKLAGGILVGSY